MNTSFILIWVSLFLIILVSFRKFRECRLRVPLTYLVLTLSIVTFLLVQNILPSLNIKNINSLFIPISIINFILIFGIYLSPANSLLKIFFFTLFIIGISFVFYPIYQYSQIKGIFNSTLITTVILFLLLSFISFIFPTFLNSKIANILLFSLVGLLVFRIILTFFYKKNKNSRLWEYSSYLAIFIFSGFIMYDTKRMFINAKNCNKEFDYLNNILSFFLDFINLLTELININQNK